MLLMNSALAHSAFYYYQKGSQKNKYYKEKQAISQVLTENKQQHGYRRRTKELRTKGILINQKSALKLMKKLNINGKMRNS